MPRFGSFSIIPWERSDTAHFWITIWNKGKVGQDNFEIWLALENNSETDVEFDLGSVSLWYHYGNTVSGVQLQTIDLLPKKLIAGQTQKYCLLKGNAIPTPKVGGRVQKNSTMILWTLEEHADLAGLMKDHQIEFEARFQFQVPNPKKQSFPGSWLPAHKIKESIGKELSTSCRFADLQKVPFSAESSERSV